MNTPADESPGLRRARLCALADVDRGKHLRWQKRGLLERRSSYGLTDVLGAALLDELNSALGPKAARAVWRRVRREIGVPGSRLEIVIVLATLEARLARSDEALAEALPRGEQVVVVDLSARARLAQERFRGFLADEAAEADGGAKGGATDERRRSV